MVQSLLLHQADLEHENMHGDTALTMAAGTASTGLVRHHHQQVPTILLSLSSSSNSTSSNRCC
eukprot:2551441-Amphidinium_carterae.1